MRKSRFIKHLDQLNEEDLREELNLLFDKLSEVRAFYAMELGDENERKKLYDKAKKELTAKYATKSYRKPRRPRIQKINKILSEMKNKSVFSHEILDLYLYDLECAIAFMRQYNFFSIVLANHIVKVFDTAIRIIQDMNLQKQTKERCKNILSTIYFSPGIYVELEDLYSACFGSDKNQEGMPLF